MAILFNKVKNSISVIRLVDKNLITVKPLSSVTLPDEKIKGITLPDGILALANTKELEEVKVKLGLSKEVKVEETKPVEEVKVEETKPVEEVKVEETKPVEEVKVEETKPVKKTRRSRKSKAKVEEE
jgi:outer membrane biosynthesis protein TonB